MITRKFADFAMYQSLFLGPQGQEFNPAAWKVDIDWQQLSTAGLSGVIIRVGIGFEEDPCFDRYLAALKQLGIPWGIYHAFWPGLDPLKQSQLVKQWCPEQPPLGVWGDFEAGHPTYADVAKYLVVLDSEYLTRAGVYSNGPDLNAFFTADQQAALSFRELWIAGYPNFIKPIGWAKGSLYKWHQFSDSTMLPGMKRPCDLSEENPTNVIRFENPTGDYFGIHSIDPGNTLKQVMNAAAAGTRIPAVVQLNDAAAAAGYAPYVDSAFCRYYSAEDDSLQGVDDWADADFDGWSKRRLDAIENQATDAQIAKIRAFLVDNEPDPPENPLHEPHPNDSYSQLAKAFVNLILACERRNALRRAAGRPEIHLGIACLPQGVPEWFEMVELVDYNDGQLFKLMRLYGHVWVCHEGVYEHDAIDKYYGDLIPGSPKIVGSGAYNFRWVYLFSILQARGLLVPILLAEFYDGGGYPGDPDEHVRRFSWVDIRIAALPRDLAACVIAICGFTCNPNSGWIGANYDDFYLSAQMQAYRTKVRNRVNGGVMTKVLADEDWAAIQAASASLASAVKKYTTHTWVKGDVALAATNPLVTYVAVNGAVHDKRANPDGSMITYDLNIVDVSLDQLWLQVAPNIWVKTSDVKLKG